MCAWSAILLAITCLAFAAGPVVPPLVPPIEGLKASDVRDMFAELHSGHPHEAIDLMEPRGTPVHAVVDGIIRKLFLSEAGGITVYEVNEPGNFCFYYAHLDRYSEGLQEGMHVKQGDTIAFVGSTGNAAATAPHLHFAISRLEPGEDWWKGVAIDPYSALLEAIGRTGKQ